MTASEIHNSYKQILNLLVNWNLNEAFHKTETLVRLLNIQSYTQSFEHITSTYKYLLHYFMKGVTDPERNFVLSKIVNNTFVLVSQVRDELLTINSNNFEFTQKRFFPHRSVMPFAELQQKIERKELLAELHEDHPQFENLKQNIQHDFEAASQYLFYYVWLSSNFDSPEMKNLILQILSDDEAESSLKALLISALTLNVWRTFDENRIMMLFDALDSDDVEVRQRAFVGLAFILTKYNRFLSFFPNIRNRLVVFMDRKSSFESFKGVFLQIIATNETDEITKKMQEEIFPELMKLRPLIDEGLNDDKKIGFDEWGEINPDWQEMIENSDVADILQEFAELEMGGADVYMSTFSMLKSFPFFNEFSNWFLPFDTLNSNVSNLFADGDKSLISTFVQSNAMCNSDRYSFCLSVLQMPESQRGMMMGSFGDAAEQIEEANKDMAMLEPNKREEIVSKHYIQDLFRFFKLNNRAHDFTNPFKTSLIIHKTHLFNLLAAEGDIKRIVAEFYFSKKLYTQAIELYEELEGDGEASAEIYQKLGYAYQQNSQIEKALHAYKRSDLIKPDDFWTNRKIAFCYRLLNDAENALLAYRHADYIKPGNLSVRLQIVNMLVELERFEEALAELDILNNENRDNPKLLRATVKTAYAAKDIAKAAYFSSVLVDSGDVGAEDYILAGLIDWNLNKNSAAIEHFKFALKHLNGDTHKFSQLYHSFKEIAIKNGIDVVELQLIADGLSSEF